MRVFCHEHKRGFFAPRQSPIKCENRGHVLGELDFAGQHSEGNSSLASQWQYCCNCEHFCVVQFEQNGLERCPVCTRRSSILFLCDRCNTISFESNTPLETKNFTLSLDGIPSPCCPGCLHPAATGLREHACDDAKVSLVTALNTCPLCNERLDIGPSFPSPVAQYLKKTKSANKTFVTFDYECGLFVPVDDGEFVLVSKNDDTDRAFVLPRSPRLGSLRDFYELYQDYYHCATPEPGEITISEPALVVPMGDGWKLLAPGVFVVMADQPKKKIAPVVASPKPDSPTRIETTSAFVAPKPDSARQESVSERPDSSFVAPKREVSSRKAPVETRGSSFVAPRPNISMRQPTIETDGSSFDRNASAPEGATPCGYCNTLIESKYAFCWKCGSARSESVKNPNIRRQEASSEEEVRPNRSRLIVQAMEDDDSESSTLQPDKRGSLLQRREVNGPDWSQSQREPSLSQRRSVLKLFVIGIIGLLLISVAALALRAVRSTSSSETAETTTTPQNPETTAPAPQAVAQPAATAQMKPVALKTPPAEVPELALEQLRQMRRGNSDHSRVLKSLSETEMKYSNDYRFPYERARLVVMDHKRNFQEEAFAALSRAAQKAINNGKSNEMLQSLNKDSDGDFQKISHGRREWAQLQKALKSRNASVLSVNEGL